MGEIDPVDVVPAMPLIAATAPPNPEDPDGVPAADAAPTMPLNEVAVPLEAATWLPPPTAEAPAAPAPDRPPPVPCALKVTAPPSEAAPYPGDALRDVAPNPGEGGTTRLVLGAAVVGAASCGATVETLGA